ncbi:ADP-ribosyltransferse [Mycobacterium paraterrae]|uniref:ADP-ribosyltransferse n=1 Tax=Mycobacterium paraterrae TaxID=577492 RepID=A0ABY3VN35_9MYCO|nr:ADP-ribosyltransferse [Mycobacterium paraterrae]UMB68888.1 ADP-ribosyltransferse [Mycobacterium paraterrae]
MAPLAVDPRALDSAGAKVISVGQGLDSAVSALTTALAGCHGMSGDDPAGASFGHAYDSSASKLLDAMATTRNGLCRLGDGIRVSAHNYSVAEANSDISGHGQPLPGPHRTGAIASGSAPSSVGHGVGVPAGWGWVANYIGMIWPTGNSAKLRGAAAAWTTAGTQFEVSEILGTVGPMSVIGAQEIPEGPAIAAAFAETHRCAAGILQQCATVATHLTTYAAKIDTVHAAIIDLLSRICNPLTGIKEVWEFLTDEDEDEIKKIANDIRVVVKQFTAEVHALGQQIASALHEAEAILSTMAQYAEKEWDHFLHATDIGRALDNFGRACGGFLREAESTVKGLWNFNPLRAVVDPKGFWHSVSGAVEKLEALTGADGEQKAEESWKELGKGIVHWDDWGTDPFTAAGETLFDVATVALPGGALSKLSRLGRVAEDAAEAPRGLHIPTPGRLPNPAPHDNPPPRNDQPRTEAPKAAQPIPAPTTKGPLPPYGVTEPKSPVTQKPPAGVEPKSAGESVPPSPSHAAVPPVPTSPASAPPGAVGPHTAHPPAQSSAHPPAGGDDAAVHGLTDAKRDEILAMPKGSRPDPSEYLSPEYIQQHLDQFHDGVTRFMPESNLDKYGIAQRDGTSFVMPRSEADALIEATRGDPRAMEKALGLVDGFLDSTKIVRIDIGHPDDYDLRVPSGNEAGANDQWIPGGKLPDGASEAVIDGGRVPEPGYSVTVIYEYEDLS